jgi:MFS family permease
MYLGAIISTLFAGYLADRWMNSERLMGICHILGAGLLYAMSQITSPDQYWTLFTITFAYSLVFNPTLSVINSLTFRNVPDGERDFPGLRVLGTIGWICAGFLVDFVCSGKVAGKDGEMIPNTIATIVSSSHHFSHFRFLLSFPSAQDTACWEEWWSVGFPTRLGDAERLFVRSFLRDNSDRINCYGNVLQLCGRFP